MHHKAKQQEEGDQVLGGEVFRSHTPWESPTHEGELRDAQHRLPYTRLQTATRPLPLESSLLLSPQRKYLSLGF